MGLSGRKGGVAKGSRVPSFPSLLLSLPSPLLLQLGKEGVLLPVGVGLPPWQALLLGRPPPPQVLYKRGQGHPIDTTIDLLIS